MHGEGLHTENCSVTGQPSELRLTVFSVLTQDARTSVSSSLAWQEGLRCRTNTYNRSPLTLTTKNLPAFPSFSPVLYTSSDPRNHASLPTNASLRWSREKGRRAVTPPPPELTPLLYQHESALELTLSAKNMVVFFKRTRYTSPDPPSPHIRILSKSVAFTWWQVRVRGRGAGGVACSRCGIYRL